MTAGNARSTVVVPQASRRYANFDFLRLVAAYSVLISHSYPLSLGNEALEPLWQASRHQIKLGGLAVLVFFTISGYLVTESYFRRNNPIDFIRARFLRLAPGLFAALAFQALIIGALVSNLTILDYITKAQVYTFIFGNNQAFLNPSVLPGAFSNVAFGEEVNGSLWTLPYEAMCYVGLLALGIMRVRLIAGMAILLLIGLVMQRHWLGGDTIIFATSFASGSILCLLRLPLRRVIAGFCIVGLGLGFFITGFRLAYPLFGSYIIIYLACSPEVRLPAVGRWGDLSYGVYPHAWPIQQTITWAMGGRVMPEVNIVLAIPIVTLLAWVSWHWVEKPALALKSSRAAAATA